MDGRAVRGVLANEVERPLVVFMFVAWAAGGSEVGEHVRAVLCDGFDVLNVVEVPGAESRQPQVAAVPVVGHALIQLFAGEVHDLGSFHLGPTALGLNSRLLSVAFGVR